MAHSMGTDGLLCLPSLSEEEAKILYMDCFEEERGKTSSELPPVTGVTGVVSVVDASISSMQTLQSFKSRLTPGVDKLYILMAEKFLGKDSTGLTEQSHAFNEKRLKNFHTYVEVEQLAVIFRNLFECNGRLHEKFFKFTQEEDKKISKLLAQNLNLKPIWSKWVHLFKFRTSSQLRHRARVIVDKPAPRCSYQLADKTKRCSNRQSLSSDSFPFQVVPDNPIVLHRMGIEKLQWTPNMVCCPEHGQDPAQLLSPSNSPKRSTTPVRKFIW